MSAVWSIAAITFAISVLPAPAGPSISRGCSIASARKIAVSVRWLVIYRASRSPALTNSCVISTEWRILARLVAVNRPQLILKEEREPSELHRIGASRTCAAIYVGGMVHRKHVESVGTDQLGMP